jgi:ribosomal protein S12 methylthiotransferase
VTAKHEQGPTRVGVISLGCAKNLVDTEVMLGHLDRSGCTYVRDPAEADVLVVSVQAILEAAEHKKKGRVRRLVVAGCLVQRYADELKDSLPEVDAFIGLDELHRIVESVEPGAGPDGGDAAVPTWGPSRYLYDDATPRRLATPPWTAYVKIAEGCDHTCSFCPIPSFRGAFRSRAPESVLAEARRLAAEGALEINLIAQDSSHYGRDLGIDEGPAALLEGLDAIEELRWIRLHYLYPNTITPRLIETMARLPRVARYVDLPLQHAHSDTLARMLRGGSATGHLRLIEKFRDAMPDVAVRTTLIVGFPGETDDEFRALLDFVREVRFDHLGVFTYSHEEGTAAGDLDDDVSDEVKNERRAQVMELQREIAFENNRLRVGRTVDVLVEGAHAETEHLLAGRMSTQAPDVDGQVLINDGTAPPGRIVPVELTDTAGYDLVGRIVDVS